MLHVATRASRSLSARLALYMAVALIPIGVMMVLQMRELQGEAQRRSEAALAGEVIEALRGELRTLVRAQGVVRALSQLPVETLMDDAACTRIAANIVQASPEYAAAAFVQADGSLNCASTGVRINVAASPTFAVRMASDDFVMIPNPRGQLTGQAVLTISQVVKDRSGARVGYVGVSVPYTQLIRMTAGGQDDAKDTSIVVYDADGGILNAVSDQAEVRALLPRDRALISLRPEKALAFTSVATDGTRRTYAAVSVLPGELFALGTWAADDRGGVATWDRASAVPLVVAMWVGSLLVAVLAGEFLVARHVRSLRRSVADFKKLVQEI